jgi:hypothetical protein
MASGSSRIERGSASVKSAASGTSLLAAGVIAGLVVAGGTFALGYQWRGAREASSQRSEPGGAATALADLEQKLAQLERKQAETEALRTRTYASLVKRLEPEHAQPPEGKVVASAAEQTAASAEPARSEGELLEQEQERVQARFARYEETLENERRDNAWAAEMEQRLRQWESELQKTHLPGTRLLRVECRTTLCSAELEHTNSKERNLLPMLLRVEGLSRVSVLKQDVEEGRAARSVAYLTKETLPAGELESPR